MTEVYTDTESAPSALEGVAESTPVSNIDLSSGFAGARISTHLSVSVDEKSEGHGIAEMAQRVITLEQENRALCREKSEKEHIKRQKRNDLLKKLNPDVDVDTQVFYIGKDGIQLDTVIAKRQVTIGDSISETARIAKQGGVHISVEAAIADKLPWENVTEILGRKGLIETAYFLDKADLIEYLTYEA